MKKHLSDNDIEEIYKLIKDLHNKHLEKCGVKLPRLTNSNGYTKDALILVYLAQDYPDTKKVSKEELTQFIRQYYPNVTDVQQARHLGAQKGWYIDAGGRGNGDVVTLSRGDYQLISLEQPYPSFHGHRIDETENWEELKKQYGYRCATCGSKEGEPNFHWPNTITKLQKSHINPNEPLAPGNIIPQCEKCNRTYRNDWIYDEKGRVIKLANPNVIKRSDKEVRRKVYKILYREFNGVNPNE